MDFKHVSPNDPLRIPARTYNAMLDAAKDHKERSKKIGGNSIDVIEKPNTIRIQNNSEVDLARFAIVGIDGPVILPSENEAEFLKHIILSGVTPTAGHGLNVAVLAEPIGAGKIGRGWISGACPVALLITGEGHTHAMPIPDNPFELAGGSEGFPVIWHEEVSGTGWALIRLASGGGGELRAKIKSHTTPTGWTNRWEYTADLVTSDGTVLTVDFWEAQHATKRPLLNRIEEINSASGLQGNGTDVGNLPGTYAVQPIPSGLILPVHDEQWICVANGVDGGC